MANTLLGEAAARGGDCVRWKYDARTRRWGHLKRLVWRISQIVYIILNDSSAR